MIELAKLQRMVDGRSERALRDVGEVYVSAVEDKLSGSAGRTGRTYPKNIGGRVVRHVSSAPGEPPAELAGELRKGVGSRTDGRDAPRIVFGSSAPHARAGTALRPESWRDALEENKGEIKDAFADGFRSAL